MEAYVLFPKSKERREVSWCEEEDIGCPSESELSMSSSSEEFADDASSSRSAGHFEMSSLLTQLPLKRGLSKFFDGNSQSFASLAAVGGLEDLAKPPRKRLKTSRSCGVGLKDAHRGRFSRQRCLNAAAAAACKKASRGQLSVIGAAPSRRTLPPVTASSARPEGVPGQALLFA
uniref:PH01B001I13.17 protein n=1 Tax=Phyllostachys edulis TaxID=38705 RepID=L0P1L6_PHYED|nr:PH01B001I13.17 [Phyllostachys edulis]